MTEKHRLYEFGPFHLDVTNRLLLRDGEPLPLTAKAFDILLTLIEHRGHIVAKESLMEKVWPDVVVRESTLAQNIFTLRKVLADDLSENRYIETIPKFGYRFIAPVEERPDHNAPQMVEGSSHRSPAYAEEKPADQPVVAKPTIEDALANQRTTNERTGLRKLVTAIIAATVLLTALVAVFIFSSSKERAPAQAKTIAVLPFRPVTADNRDEYLEYGMAETLITKLSQINQLVVRPMGAVRRYAGFEQDPLAAGHELQVESVLEGSLQQLGDKIRVTVRLIKTQDGQAIWASEFNERFTDIFKVEDTISQKIVEALALTLTGAEKKLLAKRYTENIEAYNLYQKGRYFWNLRTEEGYYKAIEPFKQAIALDPNYGLAYAGLADAYHLLGDYSYLPAEEAFPKATEAAMNALRLDDTLAEAHTSLAYAKFLYDWNWPAAEREFDKALEFSPAYATAHQWYSEYKTAMGRFDEAKIGIKKAQEIYPTSLILSSVEGWIDYIARDYDRAIERCGKTLELEPDFYPAHFWRGQAYEKKGLYQEAIGAYERALTLSGGSPEVLASLSHAYAAAGEKAKARKRFAELQALSKRKYVSPYFIALIHEGLGDKEAAMVWLEKAYQVRSRSVPFLNVDPMFDSLRSDSRFKDLLRRVNLAP